MGYSWILLKMDIWGNHKIITILISTAYYTLCQALHTHHPFQQSYDVVIVFSITTYILEKGNVGSEK